MNGGVNTAIESVSFRLFEQIRNSKIRKQDFIYKFIMSGTRKEALASARMSMNRHYVMKYVRKCLRLLGLQ